MHSSLDVGRLPPFQVLIKGVVYARGVPGLHQRAPHVRPSHRAVSRYLLHSLPADVDAERVELLHHALPPVPPSFAQGFELLLHPPVVRVEEVAKHMHLGALDVGAELNARNDAHAQIVAHGPRLGKPRCGIVIGDGQDSDAARCRQPHQFGGREKAVGGGGVGVEVYLAGGSLLAHKEIISRSRSPII
jgi:hypothetical protein